jgi:glycosyltransferase involved in cell wall biosynthesis
MRSIVRSCGTDARVIPNGIPSAALAPVARRDVAALRSSVGERPDTGLFFKMARWEREKGWTQALDAVAQARAAERRFMLVARAGGPTGMGGELEQEAAKRRLNVVRLHSERNFLGDMSEAVRGDADVIDLRFGVSPALARTLYAAADGVLANSVSEPFGLVGLEAMAAGGVAYTGGTGEDYAIGGHNAVVLETLDPAEIVQRSTELASSPDVASRIRRRARKTAQGYEWSSVVGLLISALAPSRAAEAGA